MYAPTQDSQQSQKLPTVEKNRKGHSKRSLKEKSSNVSLKKLKKGVQGSVKEALLEEMEFSVISKMNSQLNDRSKRKGEKKENVKPDIEDVFFQTLALELKQLPMFARCAVKQEVRNILFKHQMSLMSHQMPYQSHQIQQSQQPLPISPQESYQSPSF